MLVRLIPPIGTIKHVRFDENGEFTTQNERMIQRFHHKFDSIPTTKGPSDEVEDDDLELQKHDKTSLKQYKCDKCEFTSENKGVLLAHKKSQHPKEGKDE